jgi:DNA replication initiation complex subunit (GINS family)
MTDRNFYTRCTEHIQDVRNERGNTEFSSHSLNTGHTYGSIEDTASILKMTKKRTVYEQFKKLLHTKNHKPNFQLYDTNRAPQPHY